MKRVTHKAFVALVALPLTFAIAACGGGSANVDEELLPTRIPTLAAEIFVAPTATIPAPTATTAPVEPTVEPTATPETIVPSAEVTATESTTATETAAPSEEISATEAATVTESFTETSEISATPEITATEELTTTEEITEESEISETLLIPGVSSGSEVTTTEETTGTAEINDSNEVTASAGVTETTTPVVTTSQEVTESVTATATTHTHSTEVTATADVTTTGTSTETEDATGGEATEEAEPEGTAPEATNIENDPALAGLPAEILSAMETADPVRGQQLSLTNACIGCHNVDPSMPLVGPSWHNVATTAETRIPGMSSGLYLYNSIVHPNDYVVENYPPGVMLQIYGALPPQDLADLISFLLTLKEPS